MINIQIIERTAKEQERNRQKNYEQAVHRGESPNSHFNKYMKFSDNQRIAN